MIKAIVGANWGDEGKGKITDLLAKDCDIVVRFQGGANAGHTIINDYGRFALHTLPSGAFYPHITNIIGPGVALNVQGLIKELEEIQAQGAPQINLLISDRAQVVMPYHVLFDQLEEERLGSRSFGSTKSGIAPFYSDKYLKTGIQVYDLLNKDHLRAKIERVCESKNIMLEYLYRKPAIEIDAIVEEMYACGQKIKDMIADTTYFLHDAIHDNKNILMEGQLGALKDPDGGIYPFTTSSSPLAGFASVGAGVPPYAIEQVVCVVKAYSSAVGAGAFVSEIFGDEAEELRKRGGDRGEYGATTGRPRRVGWFDMVATKYGCMLQGATNVALTLIDALNYLDEIPICTHYEIDGKITDRFPVTPVLDHAKPVIKKVAGFKGAAIKGITNISDLPQAARDYIALIEEGIGVPITMISTGPRRQDIIYL